MIPKSRSIIARGHYDQQTPDERAREVNDQVNGMLQALGARVLDALKSGGQQFRKFDDAYAGKVKEALQVDPNSRFGAARNFVAEVAGHPVTHGFGEMTDIPKNKATEYAQRAAIGAGPFVGGAVRYGIPAAGAVGLADLTSRIYDSLEDEPVI